MRGTYYGGRPQVISGPDTVSQSEDIRAIVTYAAFQEFSAQWEWDHDAIREAYPALSGLTDAQIDKAIEEALA